MVMDGARTLWEQVAVLELDRALVHTNDPHNGGRKFLDSMLKQPGLKGRLVVEREHADFDAWILRSAVPSLSVSEELKARGFQTLRAYRHRARRLISGWRARGEGVPGSDAIAMGAEPEDEDEAGGGGGGGTVKTVTASGQQRGEMAALRQENAALRAEVLSLTEELERLKAAMEVRASQACAAEPEPAAPTREAPRQEAREGRDGGARTGGVTAEAPAEKQQREDGETEVLLQGATLADAARRVDAQPCGECEEGECVLGVCLRTETDGRIGGEDAGAVERRHMPLERLLQLQSEVPWRGEQAYSAEELERWNVTAVLNPWHRPALLPAQLRALKAQHFGVAEVWVVLSASPAEAELRGIATRECAALELRCFITASEYNFVYYTPWQLTLQATTKYVWFLDDDVLPAPGALGLYVHAATTAQLRESAFGARGTCRWPGRLLDPEVLIARGRTYRDGCEYCVCGEQGRVREAENLDGSRFMLQAHVKLLFREEPGNGMERPWKWLSNDMQLTYALRKYAGRASYILPCAGHPSLCGDADSALGGPGGTTVGERVEQRSKYVFRMFVRGARQVWTDDIRGEAAPRVMVLAEQSWDARLVAALKEQLEGRHVQVWAVVTGEAPWGEAKMAELAGRWEGDEGEQRLGFLSLNVGSDFPRRAAPHHTAADVLLHLTEAIRALAPHLVVLPTRAAPSPAMTAAALAARYQRTAVLWLRAPDELGAGA